MKSLYNIAGILPAQCRANPNDCGIAWSEHRKVEQVKREDVISVEAPPLTDALTEYLKETMAACMSKLMIMPKLMIDVNPADQGADQTVTTAFTLKPIDPQTPSPNTPAASKPPPQTSRPQEPTSARKPRTPRPPSRTPQKRP